MSRAVFNPALSDLRAEMESALEVFRIRYSADGMTDSFRDNPEVRSGRATARDLARDTLKEFHRHYRNLVTWEEEAIQIASSSGCFNQLHLDRMRLTLDYSKRREGFLWLEILSFSDESFVRTIQPSKKKGELCLF